MTTLLEVHTLRELKALHTVHMYTIIGIYPVIRYITLLEKYPTFVFFCENLIDLNETRWHERP